MRWPWLVFALAAWPAVARPRDPGEALPEPASAPGGPVPMSEPLAPVPPGTPRWEVVFSLAGGVADAFYDKVALQGSVRHGLGALSLEAFGARAFSWASPALDLCRAPGSCRTPTAAQLGATPGQLDWLAGLGVVLGGTSGKLSLGGLEPVRFLFEGGLGAAAVGYRWADATTHAPVAPGLRWSLAAGAAFAGAFAARLELAGLLYRTDIRGANAVERQLLLGVGLSWHPGGG